MARTSRKGHPPVSQPVADAPELVRAAIYARLSVEDNGKGSDSIDSQVAYLTDYVQRREGFRLVSVFIDNGYTGTNFDRPEFRRMLEAAHRGDINCILVKDLSRLGRNYVETGEFLEKLCPSLGLRVLAVSEGFDSDSPDSNSQLAASLTNIINDLYAKDISRKVTSALRTKMQRGDYIGNYAPYGYRKDPRNKNHLVVDPEAAAVVRQIYTDRAEGASYGAIYRRLNAEGIPSPEELRLREGVQSVQSQRMETPRWNRHVLTELLQNPVYLGHLAQRKGSQCLYAGIPYHVTDPSQWIWAENTHEPIVEQALFQRVQEVNRAVAASSRSSRGKYDHLPKETNRYRGKLFCADCGAHMKLVRSFNRQRDKAYFTFKCPTNQEHGASVCSSHARRKGDLDAEVLQALRTQRKSFPGVSHLRSPAQMTPDLLDILLERIDVRADGSLDIRFRPVEEALRRAQAEQLEVVS